MTKRRRDGSVDVYGTLGLFLDFVRRMARTHAGRVILGGMFITAGTWTWNQSVEIYGQHRASAATTQRNTQVIRDEVLPLLQTTATQTANNAAQIRAIRQDLSRIKIALRIPTTRSALDVHFDGMGEP